MRVLLGLAEAAYIPAATALIADYHGSDTRAKAIGIHIAGFSLGMIGGGSLAGYLGQRLGWRPSFFVLGAAGLLLTLACTFLLRDASPHARQEAALSQPKSSLPASVLELIRIPSFLVLTVNRFLRHRGLGVHQLAAAIFSGELRVVPCHGSSLRHAFYTSRAGSQAY